jgi:hypothetical protein
MVNCGYTIPGLQTFDLLAGLEVFRAQDAVDQTAVYGQGKWCVQAIYAAILDDQVSEIVLENPPASHEDPDTPEILGVLRTGDLPQNLALVFPRPITFVGEVPEAYQWTVEVYEQLGMAERIRVIESVGEWRPLE